MDRRRFLRGSGLSLALPSLTSLARRTQAAEERPPRRLVCIGNHLGFHPAGFFPNEAGVDYDVTPTLRPLEKHRGRLSVLSNLDHGTSGGHSGVHAFLSGVRKEEASGFPERNRSLDQAAAEHAGSATRYSSITAGLGDGTDMCWTRSGVRIPPVNSPARLFAALFVDSPEDRRHVERTRLTHRASVLDALRESAGRLNRRLDAADRDKLDQYLTAVRDVETRLAMSREWIDRPKPASPIPPVADEERMHVEEVPLFYDLLALALQTDSTRVATFEIPMGLRTSEFGFGGYHGLSHHGKDEGRLEQLQTVETRLAEWIAGFLDRLREARLLDDTLVVVGSGMGDAHRHSNRNLPILLAGGGLRHRGHVVCPEPDRQRVPLCNLWLSCLQWFGVEIDRFNKSTGTFTPMEVTA